MKRVFLTVAAAAIAGAGAWAQTTEVTSNFTSPAKSSTFGRFGRDVDNMLSVQDWKGTGFESWTAGASFANSNVLGLGFAKKLNSLYLAAYYGGALWGIGSSQFEESEEPWSGGSYKTFKTYANDANFRGNTGTHNIGLLLGVANMGFKLSLRTTYAGKEESDVIITGDTYPYANYKNGLGSIVPQIEWGMAKNLAEAGIKPKIRATLDFYTNETRSKAYIGTTAGDEWVFNAQNAFMPQFYVGLGGYNFVRGEAFTLGFDLEYTLDLITYSNEFSYLESGETKSTDIKGKNTNGTPTENSYLGNNIAPSLKFTWNISEQFAAKGKFNMGFIVNSKTDTAMALNTEYKLIKTGADTNTFTFGFAPKFDLGFQYKLLGGKLVANAGGTITPATVTVTSEKSTQYDSNGDEIEHSTSKTSKTSTTAVNTGISAGFTWNITENAALDFATGLQNGNAANIFGTGTPSLTSFTGFLFTLAF